MLIIGKECGDVKLNYVYKIWLSDILVVLALIHIKKVLNSAEKFSFVRVTGYPEILTFWLGAKPDFF